MDDACTTSRNRALIIEMKWGLDKAIIKLTLRLGTGLGIAKESHLKWGRLADPRGCVCIRWGRKKKGFQNYTG